MQDMNTLQFRRGSSAVGLRHGLIVRADTVPVEHVELAGSDGEKGATASGHLFSPTGKRVRLTEHRLNKPEVVLVRIPPPLPIS